VKTCERPDGAWIHHDRLVKELDEVQRHGVVEPNVISEAGSHEIASRNPYSHVRLRDGFD
jgi:hypothetical protein